MNNLELEKELGQIMAKEIQQEIDECVIINLLFGLGWKIITINTILPEIHEWVALNVKHEYRVFGTGTSWVFQNEQDANWFLLKWG
jgi:hypothetical protein